VSPNLANLFHLHVAAALDRYTHLLEIAQGQPWKYQAETGRLVFGEGLSFQAQVLGYEAMDSQSWLWAWAQTGIPLPETQIKSALSLKAFGEKKDVPEFVSPQCPLSAVTGEQIAMVACGMFNAQAYFRGPYAGGAMLLLIQDPQFPVAQTPPTERVLNVFPRVVFSYEIHHKRAFMAYVNQYHLENFEENGVTVITEGRREVMEAEFNEQGHLLILRSLLPKAAEAPKAIHPSDRAVPAGQPKGSGLKPGLPKGSGLRPGQPKGSGLRPGAPGVKGSGLRPAQPKGSGLRPASEGRPSDRRPGPPSERRGRFR
jgi:hypothetical protein